MKDKPEFLSVLVGISPGLLFLLVYLVQVPGRAFGIGKYITCILFALLILFLAHRWGFDAQDAILSSIGVLLSSTQILLRMLLDYNLNNNIVLGFLLLTTVYCVYRIIRKWRSSHDYFATIVLRLIIGSVLVLGILELNDRILGGSPSLNFYMLWIFYSLPLVMISILLSEKNNLSAWTIYLSFVPFVLHEIFPIALPHSVSSQDLLIVRFSNILLFSVMFIVVPLQYRFLRKSNFNLGIIMTQSLMLISLVVFSGWFVHLRNLDEALPFSLSSISSKNIILVFMPLVIIASLKRMPRNDAKVPERVNDENDLMVV